MSGQTLAEAANGPSCILYVVGGLFLILTVVLLSGKGAWLVAGYNTASKEEREKYNAKKLSRTVGAGFSVLTAMIFIMAIFENVLPASFAYVFLAITMADVIVLLVLCNTVCKEK